MGYVYFEEYSVVLLVIAFSKSEIENIEPADKRYFKKLINQIFGEMSEGPIV